MDERRLVELIKQAATEQSGGGPFYHIPDWMSNTWTAEQITYAINHGIIPQCDGTVADSFRVMARLAKPFDFPGET